MESRNSDGWWDVPPLMNWTCPECNQTTPADNWDECEVYCEDCGSHDARRCPQCHETFDHVWDPKKIADASKIQGDAI